MTVFDGAQVHFMNIEKSLLPAELLKDLELKLKQGVMEGATEEHAEITVCFVACCVSLGPSFWQ